MLGAPVRLNMSLSDITQACISISITLDIGWWVIRCRHYCTTSSILGETQLSRLEHTAIVSTICYECHTQATNKPNTTFQTFNQPSDLDLQTHCHAWIMFWNIALEFMYKPCLKLEVYCSVPAEVAGKVDT